MGWLGSPNMGLGLVVARVGVSGMGGGGKYRFGCGGVVLS